MSPAESSNRPHDPVGPEAGLDDPSSTPDAELSFDAVEAIGLVGNGIDGDRRFPYTWAKLKASERELLLAYLAHSRDAHADLP